MIDISDVPSGTRQSRMFGDARGHSVKLQHVMSLGRDESGEEEEETERGEWRASPQLSLNAAKDSISPQ